MRQRPSKWIPVMLATAFMLTARGGWSAETLTNAQRSEAAQAVADNSPLCKAARPFYWEIGNSQQRLAGSSVGFGAPDANTTMLIASASKWIFGAYVTQLRHGNLSDNEIRALTMRSGYVGLKYLACLRLLQNRQASETVAGCLHSGNNDAYVAADVGRFYYNGGHFQALAVNDLGLGGLDDAELHDAIAQQVGKDFAFTYHSPQLAAGISTSANDYGRFLRKLLRRDLVMGAMLGEDAVCTNPKTCPGAVSTPVPETESWHYSLAHWVEDDPGVGDGAYSSGGAFGFYPWIDAGKTWYGVLARHKIGSKAGYQSVQCGRQIRRAWLDGRVPPAE